MAHIIEKNNKIKEVYLTDGNIQHSKYLLFVYDNGTLVLKWCWGDVVEIQANPTLTKIGRKMILEYGEANLFGIRQRKPFQDEQGKLESIWEKFM